LNLLDSGFRGNDGKTEESPFYEFVNIDYLSPSLSELQALRAGSQLINFKIPG
jgi:hypothetical protein